MCKNYSTVPFECRARKMHEVTEGCLRWQEHYKLYL